MKGTSQALSAAVIEERSWVAVISDLVKVRLTLLVLLTTLVGFYLATQGPTDYGRMLHTILGTALLASGAAALNQLLEREHDARMRRTRNRPLPAGRLQPESVLAFGVACSVAGLAWLALATNWLTAGVGVLTLLTYLFLYTPLKRVTWLNTLVGAVPGALPPLMGWTAVRGQFGVEGGSLFVILALWQIPHFMAIAWIYREDYARAGFKMLPAVDPHGHRTARQAVIYTLALLPLAGAPFFLKLAGPVYLVAALVLGLGYLGCALQFARTLNLRHARQLFFASIIYLPALLAVLVADKLK